MKQHILSQGILAVLGLSLIACQNKEIDFFTPQGDGPVFYASMEQVAEPGTRVYADENLMVLWHADDRVGIFNKYTYNQQYRFDGETGANSGTFSKVPSETFVTGNAIPAIYAVYPYAESTTITNDCKIQLTLPAEQAYSTLNFGPGANTMVSATEDNNLLFKNLGGYLAVKLYGDNVTVSKVTLRGNKGEKLAGRATVTAPLDGDPTVVMAEDATEEITVNCAEPVTIGTSAENYTEFWFVLPPTTFEEGFTITVSNQSGGHFEKSTTKSVSVSRNHLSRMSPICVQLSTWDDSNVPPDDEIWYTTSDDDIMYLSDSFFDQGILENTYADGKGIIKLSGSLKVIRRGAFLNAANIKDLWLPDSVEEIEDYAFPNKEFQVFYIPKQLQRFSGKSFSFGVFRRFLGDERVQNDGRFVVVDNHIKLIASIPESSFTIPGIYDGIDEFAMWIAQPELKQLIIEDGVKTFGYYAFSGCKTLEEVFLPNTIEDPSYSLFDYCDAIKRFHGPSRYVSADGKTLYRYVPYSDTDGNSVASLKFIMNVAKGDLTDYVVEEDICGIDPESFCRAKDLKSITFTNRDMYISGDTFDECYNLEQIMGPGASADGRCHIGKASWLNCEDLKESLLVFAGKGISDYTVDDSCEEIGSGVFAYWPDLKNVIIPDQVSRLGNSVFWGCKNLETVTLPSLLQYIGNSVFVECSNLHSIYVRAVVPPVFENYSDNPDANLGISANTGIYVPNQSVERYKTTFPWSLYASNIHGVDFTYSFYVSSDYSQDGETISLQKSSSGEGVDFVLMGDGFSDRQIADGTYAHAMTEAMDAFFSEEPYKSFKELFNVSFVNVVSMTEGYDNPGQALGTAFGDGTYVHGNQEKVIEYAKNVVSEARIDDTVIIVIMNKDAYAGTCFMYDGPSGDYGRGLSIAFFPTNSDIATFNGLVSHEAGGHGFAKLADEYAYESMGSIPQNEMDAAREKETCGWWKNIDFTDDSSQVKWSQFINDERYASENIGCYEGGYTYWTGVWRPTENSIMRYNTGGFNAPSRYAIWYRINKLVYGESWNGTYEDFVEYDSVNRTPAAVARRKAKNYVEKPLPPLAPPVVVGHSWREEHLEVFRNID